MNSPSLTLGRRGVLRYSRWDALPVGLAAAHGLLLLLVPAAPVVALGLWWNSNTVSHHFLHTPFFRSPTLNRLFSCYLSVLLGIPQALWRQRHFAHHAGGPWRLCLTGQVLLETALVLALWAVLLAWQPKFFLAAYLPGYVGGLLLCSLHGYYEHAPETVSHHGTLYNLFFFNDGYHVEHHMRPAAHWTRLREQARPVADRQGAKLVPASVRNPPKGVRVEAFGAEVTSTVGVSDRSMDEYRSGLPYEKWTLS